MSDFKFKCPHCGQKMLCPESMNGQNTLCPDCKNNITLIMPPPAVTFCYVCPYCSKCLECDESLENQVVNCPGCNNAIVPTKNIYANKIKIIDNEHGADSPGNANRGMVVNNYVGNNAPPYWNPVNYNYVPKKRLVFILLALFLSSFGAHNFYARRFLCACLQLAGLMSYAFMASIPGCEDGAIIILIGLWAWGLYDIFMIKHDGNGRPMI